MTQPTGEYGLRRVEITSLPERIPIRTAGLTLGRDSSNSVVLDPARFPHVSVFHSRIVLEEGAPVIDDLDSRNGALVNGAAVPRAALAVGDVVQLGRDVGPRFVVTHVEAVSQTVTLRSPPASSANPGLTTVSFLRRALGLPEEHGGLQKALRTERLRVLLVAGTLLLLAACALICVFVFRDRDRNLQVSRLTELNRELSARLDQARTDIVAQRKAWETRLASLDKDREDLQEKLEELEKSESTSADVTTLGYALPLARLADIWPPVDPAATKAIEAEGDGK